MAPAPLDAATGNMMIAGVDEVGRGSLAGPVVSAAVILDKPIPGLDDSKKLSARQRSQLAELIQTQAVCYALGRAEAEEIDALNIHQATLLSMLRAIEALAIVPQQVLIDGLYVPQISIPGQAIVRGDSLVPAIAAASILAKVTRDAEMQALDLIYPGYGFAQHKGYPTASHRVALASLGACPIHRKSFSPVAAVLNRAVGMYGAVT